MSKVEYSHKATEFVREYLDDINWRYYFDEDNGVFRFDVGIEGKLSSIAYTIRVILGGIMILAYCPIKPDSDNIKMMHATVEYINRINYAITIGNLEMDHEDGEIRYRFFIGCDGGLPNNEAMKDGIDSGLYLYERIGEGLIGIIFKDMNVEQAFDSFKNSTKDRLIHKLGLSNLDELDPELISMLESLLANDEDDEDCNEEPETLN